MKIRRRFTAGGPLTRLLDFLQKLTVRTEGAEREAPSAPADRPARLAALRVPAWLRNRRFALIASGVFFGALLVGYLLAALVFFPAPIFASSRAVPRVIGMQETAARERLDAERLRIGAVTRAAHPTAPSGTVVWQEPPPGVVTPERTDITLTVSDGPRRIPVPDVAGYETEHARLLIESAGLRVGTTDPTTAPVPRNVVVNTRPIAGTTLVPGGEVTLVVSVGTASLRVPSLKGLSLDEARRALETAGLRLGTWFGQITTDVAPGEVFYQDPAAGTLSAPGTAVHLRIARLGQ